MPASRLPACSLRRARVAQQPQPEEVRHGEFRRLNALRGRDQPRDQGKATRCNGTGHSAIVDANPRRQR